MPQDNTTSSDPLEQYRELVAQTSLLGDVCYAGEQFAPPRKGTLFHQLSSDNWDTAVRVCNGERPQTIAHVVRALALGLRPCRKCWPQFGGVVPKVDLYNVADILTAINSAITEQALVALEAEERWQTHTCRTCSHGPFSADYCDEMYRLEDDAKKQRRAVFDALGCGIDKGLDAVVCGGESAPDAVRREMDPAWARSLRDQCEAAGVPFFYKQESGTRPEQCPELDGRQHKEASW